ncbi:MAG: SMC family ATPase [Actinomycetes bacterium]
MRPHVLRFQGIGPYPDLVEIDFDQLTPLGLYLIIGPTGAGKSTIFDALSFALYGDVPSGRSIVSDHEHRESPMIELEFSHRGVPYLVHREPGLPATVTRKATNPKPSAQRFTRFTTTGTEELTVTGTKDVTKHVEDLLGLTIDQFNRVILIPQNEFQEFLLASDKDKSDILDALFGTEIYKIFAERLWDEAGKLKSKAEKAEVALGQKFANIEAAVESLIDQELIDEAVDAREDLPRLIAQISERAQKAEAEADDAAQALAQANATTALAAGEAQRFDAFQELQTFLGQREIDAPRTESAQSEIDRDQQARQVLSAEDENKVAQESLFNAEAEVARLRTQLSELVSSHDLPVFSDFVAAFDSASPAQLAAELTKVINIIDQASKLYESVTQDRADMQVASNAALDANNMLTKLQARQVELQASLAICRNTEEDAVKALKDQQVLKEQVDSLDAQLLRADVEGATAALTVATTLRGATGKKFQVVNDALTQARKLQALHMAGELARELVAEAPCPVCGSTQHPALAQPSQDASTEDLQTVYDAANNANALAESAVREATIALTKAQEEFSALPNAHEQSVLRDKLAQVVTLAASAGDLQSQIKELDVALTQVVTDLTTQTVRRSEAEAIIIRLTNQIEKSLQDANDIMTEDSFDVAQPLVEQANKLIDQLLNVSEQVSVCAGAADTKARQLQNILLATNFSDCDAARFALVLEETLTNYRKLIAEFAQLQVSITGLTGKVGDQPVPDIRPNLEDAEVSQQHAHLHHQALSAKANAYSQNLKIIASARVEIDTLGPETLELIQNSKDAYHIAQVMKTGKAPLLSVQRWVQKQMFIDVCDVATQQLQILTNHRFEILLNDGDARQGQSLEVCIRDSYTGQVRPVKSMSGGEKFLTSLAMALALAEVVQRMSGGVEITSLFIDEGFGSLDRSTLDTAIDVLQKLQSGGRTVGVISHVEQMHEDIDIGIAVTPGARGSTLTVLPGR